MPCLALAQDCDSDLSFCGLLAGPEHARLAGLARKATAALCGCAIALERFGTVQADGVHGLFDAKRMLLHHGRSIPLQGLDIAYCFSDSVLAGEVI